MECKKCKAQLESGVTVCPECGTDNTPEAPKGITFTTGKLVAVIAAVVVLTALVVALILNGMGFTFSKPVETQPIETELASESLETVPATIPADGNPDDATCKGTYTVADEELDQYMSQVVATCGDAQLTNAQLQVYYWMQVQGFLGQYGSYAPYLGLDVSQPLDTQVCGISEVTMTWQQYFLEAALADWHNYQALAHEAEAKGFAMEQQYVDLVDSLPASLETDAGIQGFESAESYLAFNLGNGATIEDYQHYMRTYYEGFMYFQSEYENMIPTQDELQAYYAEHEAEYAEQGINQEDYNVNVRHILVLPEGATVDTIYTETFSDEAWAVGQQQADDILNQWLAGEKTEENFAALANQHSADTGSNANGGLYTDVAVGDMVEEFDAWCFDANRQVGDYDIVKTDLGFHIMYFSGKAPIWETQVEGDLMSERGMELIYATTDKYPMQAEYTKIALADAKPSQW